MGVVPQQVWATDPKQVGKKHQRQHKAIADQESQKWLDALAATEALVAEAITVVTVVEREADIYDLCRSSTRDKSHLLIRASHNRQLSGETAYLT